MDDLQQLVIETVADLLAEEGPRRIAAALGKIADQKAAEGKLVEASVITLLADYAVDATPVVLDQLSKHLIGAINGDKGAVVALYRTSEVSASDLSRLADALQTANAEDLENGRRWARQAGKILVGVGKLAGPALVEFLKGRAP